MVGLVDYEDDFFEEYQSDDLAELPSIEQCTRVVDEVAHRVIMPRYEGPVDPFEGTFLENYNSNRCVDVITARIQGIIDPKSIETNQDRIHGFRADRMSVN